MSTPKLSELFRIKERWTRPVDDAARMLATDFPPEATAWARGAAWEGPVSVPLDRVDFSNERSWRAAHEPEQVRVFAAKILSGFKKPIILVADPEDGERKFRVADGHHRALAYRDLGRPVYAYVAQPADREVYDHALRMHSQQVEDPVRQDWNRWTARTAVVVPVGGM